MLRPIVLFLLFLFTSLLKFDIAPISSALDKPLLERADLEEKESCDPGRLFKYTMPGLHHEAKKMVIGPNHKTMNRYPAQVFI